MLDAAYSCTHERPDLTIVAALVPGVLAAAIGGATARAFLRPPRAGAFAYAGLVAAVGLACVSSFTVVVLNAN